MSLVIVGFLTRSLGPVGYGHYSLIFAYLYIFTTLADLGLYTVLIKEIAQTKNDEPVIIANIFSLRLVCVIIALGLGLATLFFLPYPIEVKLGILIASIFSIFSSLAQILMAVFQKYLKLYYVSLADVVARATLLVMVTYLFQINAKLGAFIIAVVIAQAIHFLIILFFAKRLVKIGLAFNSDLWVKTLKKALPIAISLVFVLLYFKIDTILLSLLKSAHDVGVYSIAYKILEILIFLPAVYIGLVMPSLAKSAVEDKKEFDRLFRKNFDILAIFSIPIMAYLFLQAKEIINIVGGSGFDSAAAVLKILSLAIMLIFFGNLGGNAVVALDLQKKALWAYFVGAVLNIGANLIFIPQYSFFATAWITVLTELLITVALFGLIVKEKQISPNFKTFFKACLATLITVSIVESLNFNFIGTTVMALIYFPILYFFKGFSKTDLRELFKIQSTKLPVNI